MRDAKMQLSLALLAFLFLACGGGGGGGGGGDRGAFIYVRASGSDRNSGSSPAEALRSIQAAVDKARSGNRIIVGPGRYSTTAADVVVNVDGRRGSASAPIEIIADINGTRTGDPPGTAVIDANGRPFVFRFTNAAFFVVDGFTITGSSGANAAGVHIRTDSRNIVIRNCEIAANAFDGIRIESSSGILIFNNLIHANQQRGIQLGGNTVETRIVNNTVAFNGNDGISGRGNGSRDIFLRNNIVYQNSSRGIDLRDSAVRTGSGYDADYNLVYQLAGITVAYGPETPIGINDIFADPRFVAGFRLSQTASGQPVTSPAVDAADPATDAQLADALRARSTKTNLDPDVGRLDLGYHYPGRFEPPPTRTLPPVTTPPAVRTPTPAAGNTLFVRTSGSDTRDGRSPTTALRTIQAAVNRATAGVEIVVGPGTYAEVLTIRNGGRAGNPITLRANPRGDRTGDPPGDVTITGSATATTSIVLIDNAPHVVIDGFRITNSTQPAIQVRRESSNVEIRNCEIFDNAEDGIRVQDSDDVVLFNNLIYCNLRRGILIGGATSGSRRAQVVNNTIAQNGDRGIFIGNQAAASPNAFLRNNIVQNNRVSELQVVTAPNSLAGFDADYNLVYDEAARAGQYVGPTPGPHDIVAAARFTDIASCEPLQLHPGDYRLAQTGAGQSPQSPGVDAGDPATASRYVVPLLQRTTATNNALDTLPLDLGYHFLP